MLLARRERSQYAAAVTNGELALTAALGASLLTGLTSLGVIWFQERRRGKASDGASLHAAIVEMLSRSLGYALRARTMAEALKLRSGFREALGLALRQRKPADLFELHNWMVQDLGPLNVALGELWIRADQEGVRLANDLVASCIAVSEAALASRPIRHPWGHLRTYTLGYSWTPEMQASYDRAAVELAHARKRFVDYARARLGRDAVDVFVPEEPNGAEQVP